MNQNIKTKYSIKTKSNLLFPNDNVNTGNNFPVPNNLYYLNQAFFYCTVIYFIKQSSVMAK